MRSDTSGALHTCRFQAGYSNASPGPADAAGPEAGQLLGELENRQLLCEPAVPAFRPTKSAAGLRPYRHDESGEPLSGHGRRATLRARSGGGSDVGAIQEGLGRLPDTLDVAFVGEVNRPSSV